MCGTFLCPDSGRAFLGKVLNREAGATYFRKRRQPRLRLRIVPSLTSKRRSCLDHIDHGGRCDFRIALALHSDVDRACLGSKHESGRRESPIAASSVNEYESFLPQKSGRHIHFVRLVVSWIMIERVVHESMHRSQVVREGKIVEALSHDIVIA